MTKKKLNDLAALGGLVYSSNADAVQESQSAQYDETPPPGQQQLKVWLEKKGRGGKIATIVRGFEGNIEDLEALAKVLKSKIGTGGSAKDDEIIIQGNHQQKVYEHLVSLGYKAKKAGG